MKLKNASLILAMGLSAIAMSASVGDTIQDNTYRAEGLGQLNEWFAVDGRIGGGGPSAAAVLALHQQGDTLYVSRRFSTIAGMSGYSAVAGRDGQAWTPVGDGFDARVTAMTLYQGSVIAAVAFTHSGTTPTSGIARCRPGRLSVT